MLQSICTSSLHACVPVGLVSPAAASWEKRTVSCCAPKSFASHKSLRQQRFSRDVKQLLLFLLCSKHLLILAPSLVKIVSSWAEQSMYIAVWTWTDKSTRVEPVRQLSRSKAFVICCANLVTVVWFLEPMWRQKEKAGLRVLLYVGVCLKLLCKVTLKALNQYNTLSINSPYAEFSHLYKKGKYVFWVGKF